MARRAREIETKEDLLDLLNAVRHDELAAIGAEDEMIPFTIKQINYYCNPAHTEGRYRHFEIPKKSGGVRQITAPRTRSYMELLRCLNQILKTVYSPSEYAMGFTEGRSVATNAAQHVGQHYVFNTDLKDFFPSIHQARVWKRLQLPPIRLKKKAANIIAGLCAIETTDEEGEVQNVLPQGAPTSPILTNMVCDKLDHRLAGLAKRFGLRYSRYADDITFSSMRNVFEEGGDFRKELRRIVEEQDFTINEKKTRLQRVGERQEVTGIIVNRKLNVNRNYVRSIRNLLYIWRKHGEPVAKEVFARKYNKDKGHLCKKVPDMHSVLRGKLQYLRMVKGDDDSVYKRLRSDFDRLTGTASSEDQSLDVIDLKELNDMLDLLLCES